MTLHLSSLTAISPIDGRYARQTETLRSIASEYGLIYYRCLVEIRWFQFLAMQENIPELRSLTPAQEKILESIIHNFDEDDARRVKGFEATTNHDVKAVEYLIKEKFKDSGDAGLIRDAEFVHFACTSEDINNLAYGLMLKAALREVLKPVQEEVVDAIAGLARRYAGVAMLSRTHGQVASPTTMGKEMANVVARLRRQLDISATVPFLGKINGAVGNFNAHASAYPDLDWIGLSEKFVTGLGLDWNPYTTQIEPHDYIAEAFQALTRFNTILIDFNRDIWSYISIGYFKQKKVEGETGSSTMPHKVNPIDFENSEGNLGIGNAVLSHLAEKLPISRWQRDLTDSTVLRNVGVGIAYSLIAYRSAMKGIGKLELNQAMLANDLDNSWEVLAEPIQTIMRKQGIDQPYEKLKTMTRGESLNRESIRSLVASLDLPPATREQILAMTPATYVGDAEKLVERLLAENFPPNASQNFPKKNA